MDPKAEQAKELLRAKRAGNWFDAGVQFRCIHPECSDCCSGRRGPGYVWVSMDEMLALANNRGITFDSFTRKYVRLVDGAYSLVEKANYDCIFLRDGKCEVYAARPIQCRTYPFWPEVMTSPKRWEREEQNCPGVNVDETVVTGEEVERQLAQETENREKSGR
ncbi:MAG: YkgJ family cysteine cluster protein [Planctomycetes bacterium]|nr:YkgJ family cysteine cluster protein [Planctomycetota bacterium]